MRPWISALLLALPAMPPVSVEEGVRRIQAHWVIDDPTSALEEAERLYQAHPTSKEAESAFVEALAAAGMEERAIDAWGRFSSRYPDLAEERDLLEEIAWGVLKKSSRSTQQGVRLAGLIGAYLTRDVRAVPILQKMMRDSNAMVRSVAVQMAGAYGDAPLKDEIVRLMAEEKVWLVRMQVIQTAGQLRIQSLKPKLTALVQSDKTMVEERHAAIEALLHLSEEIPPEEIVRLAGSNRAGLRHLACAIAAHFQVAEVKGEVLKLLHDTNPDVKIAALNALGLFYREGMEPKEVLEHVRPRLEETDPGVAITAAWVAMLMDPKVGQEVFEKWLKAPLSEHRRLAAAALAATGERGVPLAREVLRESQDPYVRLNVALGLLGQREEVAACSDCLYTQIVGEKRMWMWDSRPNPLFQAIAPSQVRHVDQIPNYPEAIDQMTRLNIVSLLALVDDPRAMEALTQFLGQKKWGITGVAAATLLREGDETALEVVRQLVQNPDTHVRLQACLVLAMYGKDETVLAELQGAYQGADFENKLHILEALGNIGSAESFRFLVSALQEPFPLLRIAAAAALIQSVNR